MKRDNIEIRGARVHNLKNLDIDIPLNRIVGVAGVSGSGKSSLALGVVYAEGSRRYLEALSTYTRRRISQAPKADVDEILHVPAAIALRQRPGVPGIRSTFGTGTELLNSLRLMFSRLASHRCPNGHYCPPTLDVAAGKEIVCPECGAHFFAPSAEELSFNGGGACRRCGGIGTVMTVDRSTLIPDESLTIDQGAVAPWNSLMWALMTDVCRAMGVRTDVPFRDLTPEEKAIVYDGPAVKKHILYNGKSSELSGVLGFTYYNAGFTGENGYEIYAAFDKSQAIHDAALQAVEQAGGRELQTLEVYVRSVPMEKGFALKQDFKHLSPYECAMGWAVAENKDFIGKAAALERKAHPKYRMVGLEFSRESTEDISIWERVYWYGVEVGRCAQTIYGYTVDKNIGFATLRADVPDGAEVTVGCNDSPAVVVNRVFC